MKVFVESSLLVEYLKGTKTELLEFFLDSFDYACYSNAIVYSEFLFYYLGVIENKSPLSVKESKKIEASLKKHEPIEMFNNFQVLTLDETTTKLSYEMMKKYNLLPNDALILATVIFNEIEVLASYDQKDFTQACISENIKLISDLSDI